MSKIVKFSLFFILFIAFYLRFYNLMHDAPYFFNPDERNMAGAVTRFTLPSKLTQIPSCLYSEFTKRSPSDPSADGLNNCNLNPHFFAYGQFPLYLAFASDQLTTPFISLFPKSKEPLLSVNLQTTFPQAIYWLRFYSALFSVGTVYIVFLISQLILNYKLSLLTSLLVTFTPGLIQSAHFGTTESLLTFFFMLVIFLSLKLQESFSVKYLIFIALSIGLSLGSKLTGMFFLFPPFAILLAELLKSASEKRKKFPVFILGLNIPAQKLFKYTASGLLILFITLLSFVISSPYNLVQPENFKSAVFGYESDVATGKYEAFYTRQFFASVPFVFQSEKVFPYILGWPVFVSGLIGLLLIIFLLIKQVFTLTLHRIRNHESRIKNKNNLYFLTSCFLLLTSFLFYLIPNAMLFAKWSRFMTPLLPFFAIFAGFFLFCLKKIFSKKIFLILTSCFLILALSPGLAFFSIYKNEDSRVTTSKWIYENIPDKSYILSETANVIDIPLGIPDYKFKTPNYSLSVISFDFYHLNERRELYTELLDHLEKADFIFIPSRRIFKNHPLQPEKFKTATKYYELLFGGALGFEEIKQFSSFPMINAGIIKFKFPDEDAEETFTVFDHPVIRIFKKIRPLNQSSLDKLFNTQTN